MKSLFGLAVPNASAVVISAVLWRASLNSAPAEPLHSLLHLILFPPEDTRRTDQAEPARVLPVESMTPVQPEPSEQSEQTHPWQERLSLMQSLRAEGRIDAAEQVFAKGVTVMVNRTGASQAPSLLARRARTFGRMRAYERAQSAWVLLLNHSPEDEDAAEAWPMRAEQLSRTGQDPAEVERALPGATRLGGDTEWAVAARRVFAARLRQEG